MSTSRTWAGRPAPALHPARQQLDELDALLQRMLSLPVDQADEEVPSDPPPRPAPQREPAPGLAARDGKRTSGPAPSLSVFPPAPPVAQTPPPAPVPAAGPAPTSGEARALPAHRSFLPGTYPSSYMVVETFGPRVLSADEQDSAGATAPGKGRTAQGAEPRATMDSTAAPAAGHGDEPDPAEWVPLRTTWQPTAQTWKPLAESWAQAQREESPPPPVGPAGNPSAARHPVAPPSTVLPLPMNAAAGPLYPPSPFEATSPPASQGLAGGVPASPIPESGPSQVSVAPPRHDPFWLLPAVWFNLLFDALLSLAGPPGRWLCGRVGRNLLACFGFLCLAAAGALLAADGFGWKW